MNEFYGEDPQLLIKLGNRSLNFSEDVIFNISVFVNAQYVIPREKELENET
jgi:hypothetical protein